MLLNMDGLRWVHSAPRGQKTSVAKLFASDTELIALWRYQSGVQNIAKAKGKEE